MYNVDGQTAFADGGSYGVVGYGSREDENNRLYLTNAGTLVTWAEYIAS